MISGVQVIQQLIFELVGHIAAEQSLEAVSLEEASVLAVNQEVYWFACVSTDWHQLASHCPHLFALQKNHVKEFSVAAGQQHAALHLLPQQPPQRM